MAATKACKKVFWIQRLLEEFRHKQEKMVILEIVRVHCTLQEILPSFTDQAHKSSIHFIRKVVAARVVDMQKIHTDENLADVITKPISTDKFTRCMSSCGLAVT